MRSTSAPSVIIRPIILRLSLTRRIQAATPGSRVGLMLQCNETPPTSKPPFPPEPLHTKDHSTPFASPPRRVTPEQFSRESDLAGYTTRHGLASRVPRRMPGQRRRRIGSMSRRGSHTRDAASLHLSFLRLTHHACPGTSARTPERKIGKGRRLKKKKKKKLPACS